MNAQGRVLRFAGFQRTVSDLGRSLDFYGHGLGFSVDTTSAPTGPARSAGLMLGDESIQLLACAESEGILAVDAVASVGFQHIAIVARDMDAAMERLQAFSPVAISRGGPVRLPDADGGVTAFKFRDPDGHPLELISFPQGVGDARWHRASSEAPTLGIDHSAISVADIDRSIDFYVEGLGLSKSSQGVNRGPAQARLDGVDPSVVTVVALTPQQAQTPHVELLGYQTPVPQAASARPPSGVDRSDRMVFMVDDLAAVLRRLEMHRPGRTHPHTPVGHDAALVRDDDGHLLVLRQQAGHLTRSHGPSPR